MGDNLLPPFYREYKKIILHINPSSIDLMSSEITFILDIHESYYHKDYILSEVHPDFKFDIQIYFNYKMKKVEMKIVDEKGVYSYESPIIIDPVIENKLVYFGEMSFFREFKFTIDHPMFSVVHFNTQTVSL